jgi:eukaryotic-like serine/threonine-protein kinase
VEAYFAAIDAKNYAMAWRLGGDNVGGSYTSFVTGFNATASDSVTILSVSGNTVTARLTAEQTDGTVKTYQGTYTVDNGAIVKFAVQQIG